MKQSFSSGAAKVATSTATDSSHNPLLPRPTGPENRLALSTIPAVLTVISVSRQVTPNSDPQARYSASPRDSVSARVLRKVVPQRAHATDTPGGSDGVICTCPQQRHSASRAGVRLALAASGSATLSDIAVACRRESIGAHLGQAFRSS
jgi:hypothetical protein